MYAITNASSPPVTQAGERSFRFALPAGAVLDFCQAKGPSGIWVNVSPRPTDLSNRRYTVNFPLRPGETLVKFGYHLPYAGPVHLHLSVAYPIRNFGIFHPPSISFTALHSHAFRSPGIIDGLQLEQVVAQPVVRDVPAFTVFGIGTRPDLNAATASPRKENRGVSTGAVQTAPPPEATRRLWLPIVTTAFLAALAILFVLWEERRRYERLAMMKAAPGNHDLFVDALKKELMRLESERIAGSISPEEYTAGREALDETIRRALTRYENARSLVQGRRAADRRQACGTMVGSSRSL
jgi:hypothetical protein